MRLLDTATLELKLFQRPVPPYAILSHVWGEEEVTYYDITNSNKVKEMHGFKKIVSACNTARRDGLGYIWVDTCCINKDSSAELSEAINSMYKWYKDALVCYAYLSDVPSEGDHQDSHSLFAMSRWFTRGWTLQELIAPKRLIFYARDWVDIGTKATLQDTISFVTGISPEVMMGEIALDDVPVAVRMYWAANRNTTREEDVAYSLMGIFDIHMPLLYGEGRKAFIRLQHEIIKKSIDHSIFAWTEDADSNSLGSILESRHRGILAHSPREFRNSGNVERIHGLDGDEGAHGDRVRPYTITNSGLYIQLPIVMDPEDPESKTMAFLNCRFSKESEPIVITLSPHPLWPNVYLRSETTILQSVSVDADLPELTSIYVVDDHSPPNPISEMVVQIVVLSVSLPSRYVCPHIEPIDCYKATNDNREIKFTKCFLTLPCEAVLVFEDRKEFGKFAIIGGIGNGGMLWCNVISATESGDASRWVDLNDYRSSLGEGGVQWSRKFQFLDRASKNLKNGWTVTARTLLNNMSDIHIDLKRRKSARQAVQRPTALPRSLDEGKVSILVIPPAFEHGFMADINDLPKEGRWTSHSGCLISSIQLMEPRILPFRNIKSGDQFFLLVSMSLDHSVISIIEEKKPTNLATFPHALALQNALKHSYSVNLNQNKVVFVTINKPRDVSVADCIITLSIQEKPNFGVESLTYS